MISSLPTACTPFLADQSDCTLDAHTSRNNQSKATQDLDVDLGLEYFWRRSSHTDGHHANTQYFYFMPNIIILPSFITQKNKRMKFNALRYHLRAANSPAALPASEGVLQEDGVHVTVAASTVTVGQVAAVFLGAARTLLLRGRTVLDDFDDGFTLVIHNKRLNKSKRIVVKQRFALEEPTNDCDLPRDTVLNYVKKAKVHLRNSQFLPFALSAADKALNETGHKRVDQIICFGLGKFSESVTSRYQLAFLLILQEKFQCPVQAYDPAFTPAEQQILPEEYDFELIEENEEGQRVVSPDICTLVFAPHCPKQLTNNFLWANWSSNLKNCIFLCNSFERVIANPSCLPESARYIIDISPYTEELLLANIFRFKDVFNDLAFHTFNKTNELSPKFWSKDPNPPVYCAEDTGLLIPKKYVPGFKNTAPVVERNSQKQHREKAKRIPAGKSRDAAV
ncbi:hypothetical protein B566_EDAN009502 [Ephemera danica]|nr:hypothetical protein B566_EDAN009502 [Ephemera danica]